MADSDKAKKKLINVGEQPFVLKTRTTRPEILTPVVGLGTFYVFVGGSLETYRISTFSRYLPQRPTTIPSPSIYSSYPTAQRAYTGLWCSSCEWWWW